MNHYSLEIIARDRTNDLLREARRPDTGSGDQRPVAPALDRRPDRLRMLARVRLIVMHLNPHHG